MSNKKVSATKQNDVAVSVSVSADSGASEINPTLLKHHYLQEIITIDPDDDDRYICDLCTTNQKGKNVDKIVGGQVRFLKRHLKGPTHFGYTPEDEKKELAEAIEALSRVYKPDLETTPPKNQKKTDTKREKEEIKTNSLTESKSRSNFLTNNTDATNKFPLSDENEMRLYLSIAQFIIKNHLPFNSAEEILNLIKFATSEYDPNLIKRAHISNTMVTKIIREGIGEVLQERIFDILKSRPYSILVEDSFDIYGGKYCAVLVRYVDAV